MEEQVNQIGSLIRRQSIQESNYDSYYDNFDDDCVTAISCSKSVRDVQPGIMFIQIGNTETEALVDLGSISTEINKYLANALVMYRQEIYWKQPPTLQDLKNFSNELIKAVGVTISTVKISNCIATNQNVTVVEDGQRPIIGPDLFPQFGCH